MSVWEKKTEIIEKDTDVVQKDTVVEEEIKKDSVVVKKDTDDEKVTTYDITNYAQGYMFYNHNMELLDEKMVIKKIEGAKQKYVQVGLYRKKPIFYASVLPKYKDKIKKTKTIFEARKAYYYSIDFGHFDEGEKILLYALEHLKGIDDPFIRVVGADGSQYRIQWINGKKYFFVEIK